MPVVDVDTHWECATPGTDPLAPWADLLPKRLDNLAFGIAGELLRALAPGHRPDSRTLLPCLVRLAEERGGPVVLHPLHDSSSFERMAWMDRVGIDYCLVNPGAYWQGLEFIGEDRTVAAARCNDDLADQLSDHADRLHGVAVLDLTDPRAVARELERARARGHRLTRSHRCVDLPARTRLGRTRPRAPRPEPHGHDPEHRGHSRLLD